MWPLFCFVWLESVVGWNTASNATIMTQKLTPSKEGIMADISARIFSLSPDIRYVAIYRNGELFRQQRDDIDAASESESDRYEELLV